MAVTFKGNDPSGQFLDTQITNMTATLALINSSTSPLHYHMAKQQLDMMQRNAVDYYMGTGRITAAVVLSTLS
jgi:hypothetical protein